MSRLAWRARGAVVALVCALATVAGCLAAGTSAALPPSQSAVQALSASQLAGYLREAASIKKVPADLAPPLSDPHTWGPEIVENGCQLSHSYLVVSQPCVYGDTTASTSVALFGDSHAGIWFPALNEISLERHWRLLIFTKAGCSPPEVKLNLQCNIWRRNSEAQIAAVHPAIVFVSWARWIESGARADSTVVTGYGSPWLDGIAATFQLLRQSSDRVIWISDVPTLKFGAARCISRHLTNVKPCNSTPRKTAIFLPKVRAAEFQLANHMGVASIDPTPWFCTPTVCPVLVHNIMVYYDSAHMTPPWSLFISPVLDTSITSILSGSQGAGHSHP